MRHHTLYEAPLLTLAPTTSGGPRSFADQSSGKAAPLLALGICRALCACMAVNFATLKRPLFDKYNSGLFQGGFLHLSWMFSMIHLYIDTAGREPIGPWYLEGRTSAGFILVVWGIQIVPLLIHFLSRKVRSDRSLVPAHISIYFYENSSHVLPGNLATSIMHV